MRNNCLFCGSSKMMTFQSLNKMPVFMGTVREYGNYKFLEMKYDECLDCGNIQLKQYPDLESLYLKNHNVDLVGELWRKHFDSFKNFIGDLNGKKVLEISDPAAKLAKICDNYDSWTILEHNPHFVSTDKIRVIKQFFSKDTQLDFTPDVIVHSHFFEHSLHPFEDLRKMWEILPPNGEMFFSVPDLWSLIKQSNSPTALNFEHTYYYNIESMSNLLKSAGFEIRNITLFDKHSIFFHVEKTTPNEKSFSYKSNKDIIKSCYDFHRSNIEVINEELKKEKNVFIYGAHVTSQYYLFNGLNLEIRGILDRSVSKNGEYLYGTSLKTYFPDEILKYEECSVIVSHSSVYKDEIIDNLSQIIGKKDVKFL